MSPYAGTVPTPATCQGASMEYRLRRTGNVDLVFVGTLLAEQDTRDTPDQARWAELRVWRTDSGKYVVQRLGRSTLPGEVDKITTRIVNTPAEVAPAMRSKQGGKVFMSNLALDVLAEAAGNDSALRGTDVERI
jgi:hypothetical protein